MLAGDVPMRTERFLMLTENVHLVPFQDHVTGTCLLKSIPQSVSKRRFPPSLSGQGPQTLIPECSRRGLMEIDVQWMDMLKHGDVDFKVVRLIT